MGIAGSYGSISDGKWADMVITNGNPLEDIASLESPLAVVKHGQWVGREHINAIIESAESPSGWLAGIGMLLEYWLLA